MTTREKLTGLVDSLDEAQLEAYCQRLLKLKELEPTEDDSQARPTDPSPPR